MTSHAAFRILRGIAWLLLPLAVIGLTLHFGTATFRPQEVAAVPAAPEVSTPAPEYPVALPLQHADGSPAVDGVVLFFAPEITGSRMDAQGVAHTDMVMEGTLRFLAYAPGHALYEGQREDPRDPTPVRLEPLPEPELPDGELLRFLPRRIVLVDEQESPMTNVLLLGRAADRAGTEPWVAFSDATGVATFPEATEGPLHVEAFTPGLPPRQAMRLGQLDLEAGQTEARLLLQAARIEVAGLPPAGLLSWKRLEPDQLMPMVQVSEDGEARLGPIPPGNYRLQVGNRLLDVQLDVGLNRVNFSAAVTMTQQ